MNMQYVPTNVPQKWILPSVSFIIRPNIFGAQKYVPANMPKIAATPITMWKWPTTKYVPCRYTSMEGCARKNPLTPPETNMETNPNANSEALVICSLDP